MSDCILPRELFINDWLETYAVQLEERFIPTPSYPFHLFLNPHLLLLACHVMIYDPSFLGSCTNPTIAQVIGQAKPVLKFSIRICEIPRKVTTATKLRPLMEDWKRYDAYTKCKRNLAVTPSRLEFAFRIVRQDSMQERKLVKPRGKLCVTNIKNKASREHRRLGQSSVLSGPHP